MSPATSCTFSKLRVRAADGVVRGADLVDGEVEHELPASRVMRDPRQEREDRPVSTPFIGMFTIVGSICVQTRRTISSKSARRN